MKNYKNKAKKLILFVIFCSIPFLSLGMSQRPPFVEREVKVLIHQGVSAITLHGSPVSISGLNGKFIIRVESPLVIQKSSNGLIVNGKSMFEKALVFASESGAITIQSQRYRGKAIVLQNAQGQLLIINELPLEEYLRGVVASEMSQNAPLEALKAQAIAARTYTIYHMMNKNVTQPYDLPKNSQAYRGVRGEHTRCDQAVQETAGIFLEYHNKIFPSFFHSRCGGYTLTAKEVWPTVKDAPAGSRCKSCVESKETSWKYWLNNSELRNRLMAKGYRIPKVFSVTLYRNTQTDRIEGLQLDNQYIPAAQLRNILGPDRLRSTFFTIKLGKFSMRFYGRGWGHGVGLCQYGAIELGKKNISYQRILNYYYPQARLVQYS